MNNQTIGRDIKKALGQNIKHFRFHRQFSQAELAEKADISITFLSNIERGLKYPKAQVLGQIALSLNVEVWQLFQSEISPEQSKEWVSRLASDMKTRVIQTMDTVITQYGGEIEGKYPEKE
jgi:transcriptional regulator with XRE-family HTH domain